MDNGIITKIMADGLDAIDAGGFFMGGLMGAIVMPAISEGVSARARRDNSNYQYEISLDEMQNHEDKLHFFQMLEGLAKKAKIRKHVLKSHPVHLSSPERVRVFHQYEDTDGNVTLNANNEPILVPVCYTQMDDSGQAVRDESGNPILYVSEEAERWVSNKLFKLPTQGFRLKDSQGKMIRFKPIFNQEKTLTGYSIQLSERFCKVYYKSFLETLKPQPETPGQTTTRDDRDNIELFWRAMAHNIGADTQVYSGHMSSGETFWKFVCATAKVVSYFLVAIAGIVGIVLACIYCWPAVAAAGGAAAATAGIMATGVSIGAGVASFVASVVGGISWCILSFAGWRTWFS